MPVRANGDIYLAKKAFATKKQNNMKGKAHQRECRHVYESNYFNRKAYR